jgi:hypothetical protein
MRGGMRERLLAQIALQPAELLSRCQVLVDIDGGEVSIGRKRQRLLDASVGEYIVFIDDDDIIASDYLGRVFDGIDLGVDHIGIGMSYEPFNAPHHLVECSMHHEWTHDGTKYLRSPQHTCAVKASLARFAGFDDVSFSEDRTYAERLKPLIKSEYVIKEPIYRYLFDGRKS